MFNFIFNKNYADILYLFFVVVVIAIGRGILIKMDLSDPYNFDFILKKNIKIFFGTSIT